MNTTIKISVIAAAITLAAVSCKKKEQEKFTATDVTGTTVVSGHVSKAMVASNGSGGWTNNAVRVPTENVKVSITIAKRDLYPNSNAQGADVYSATTDQNGNYSIQVKTNSNGVPAKITIEGFAGTIDTVQANGTVKTGPTALFTGTTVTTTLVMGQNIRLNHEYQQQPVSTNPGALITGTAMITGSLSVSMVKETTTGTVVAHSDTNIPVPAGHRVYLSIDNDPNLLAPRIYETTTDANGNYTFIVTTVTSGNAGFPQDVEIWANDYRTTRDTLRGTSRVPGKLGVFQKPNLTINGVYNNDIKNAQYLRYLNFVAD